MKRGNREITCDNCGVLDLNCYEQCKDDKCKDCFGASFDDCEICDEREARAKEEGMKKVELTIDEAVCVKNFIEEYIFKVIRDDTAINSVYWLADVMTAYIKCKQAAEGGDNEAE